MARTAPILVFVLVFAFMFWLVGHRLILSNSDEGIYLDAGRRVAEGQAPFLDFFYLSGPGTPWALGLSMKLFGVNLPAARLPLMVDISLMAALVFWMTRRLAGQAIPALIAAFLFLSLTIAQESALLANHRWDSGALALAAIALVWVCRGQPSRPRAALAGLAVAAATWTTPTLGLLAITLTLWHFLDARLRPSSMEFLAGGLGGLTAGLASLWAQGALGAMVDQLFWSARHYSGANRMAYGDVVGGYAALFQGLSGAEMMIAGIIVFLMALPAWLPIVVTTAWLIYLRRCPGARQPDRLSIAFLLACGAVIIAAQAPRLDLAHLLFASPLYYALAAGLAPRLMGGNTLRIFAGVCLLAGCVHAGFAGIAGMKSRQVETAVGRATMRHDEARQLERFASHIRPGDTLFVYPYRPVLYFALDGRNPTRYSFLQPGMSSAQDEATVLAGLRINPPQWVIYLDARPADYLRIWPSSDPSRLRMESIEQFISSHYSDLTQAGPYTLKRRR